MMSTGGDRISRKRTRSALKDRANNTANNHHIHHSASTFKRLVHKPTTEYLVDYRQSVERASGDGELLSSCHHCSHRRTFRSIEYRFFNVEYSRASKECVSFCSKWYIILEQIILKKFSLFK
ncbi:hypothetical protein TNCV_212691 [Trichonephila clavipes]|nr:hypothetical protein TNCV_212691 [Trichonephila clavipes]